MGILKNIKQIFNKQKVGKKSLANIFYDNNSNLTWKCVNTENISEFSQEFKLLNSWSSSKDIQRFISRTVPLDTLFEMFTPDKDNNTKGLYFAYDEKQFVGLIMVRTILSEEKQASIDYIITNPELVGKGYATRMISSAQNHIDLFCHGIHNDIISSSIEIENIGSRKAFEKNNFSTDITDIHYSSGRKYLVYYSNPRQNISNKTKELCD